MTREELAAIALRYETAMADAMLAALGVSRTRPAASKGAPHKRRGGRFKGARELMRQRYGVRL